MISLYETGQQKVVPLRQRDDGKVSIYVCGPTVYGPPHLGHGRMALVYDILRRYLVWSGLEVNLVSNVTDIDDQIIERARSEGRPWQDITTECEAVWWDGMSRINVSRPDHTPHATEYVAEMVQFVGELVENDTAYVTDDGVYLAVQTVPDYGYLAHQCLDDLVEGAGDREVVGVQKRHPADFALWKFAKEGEPAWPSPWGDGRPGWHTECVVMSLDILGEGFDLHTGGLDLVFPHHENERAQASALGKNFAQHWMHNGFVELDGEKMSKSIGNIQDLLDLSERYDPRAYRLLVLQAHYRSPIEVTDGTLVAAEAALERLDSFARRTAELSGAASNAMLGEFSARMDDDLDTAGAVDLMFRQVREANTLLDSGATEEAAIAAANAREIAGAVGLEFRVEEAVAPPEIQAMAEERFQARSDKDFERADMLRDQLAAAGWSVEDGADGPLLRPVRAAT